MAKMKNVKKKKTRAPGGARRFGAARTRFARVSRTQKLSRSGQKRKVVRTKHTPRTAQKEGAKVEALIRLGKERGYITYDEILREFPTIEDNVMLLDDMYERFGSAGIDVLEGGGMLEDTSADTVLERKKLQHRRSDSSYDSVQMYLREIGQYPLLNGEQEKELAKRILVGDEEARAILARSNLRLVVSIAKK